MNCIETDRLNLWYGNFQALREVTIQIRPRRITGLIGPSGCGKSTLLRSFNRISERDASVRITGTIRILGEDIHAPEVSLVALRRAVGMVFQRPNPLPISIFENVAFGLRIHQPPEMEAASAVASAVEEALVEVGLWEDLRYRLDEVATGLPLEQQQRLCIARLLPLKPEIILLDEPCSALDAKATLAIEDLLRRLVANYSIVIVTHSMAQARRISQDCFFMLLGEVVESGPTEAMFSNPRDRRTGDYIEGRFG
jgi:phosphate transport system ATP-binding protein